MRADRLISLLMLLQTRGRLTAQELASRLEVSERTIYRDLEALSSAGIPVYAERGPGGGISLVDGYQTRLTGLTGPEAQALFLLSVAGPLSDLGLDRALNDALLKLSAALPASQREDAQHLRERIYMDSTWWYYSRESLPYLSMLQDAVCHDRSILLHYHDEHDSPCQRLLHPYGLVSKAGVWFLVAVHAQSGELHILRVSRIQSIECSDETFIRPADFDLAATWRDHCRTLEAQHPQLAPSARAIPGEATSQHRPTHQTARRAHQKKHVSRQPQQKKEILPDRATKKRAFARLSSPATTKKANSLFATRQPATSHQKKANMGRCQLKKRLFSSKVLCNALHPAFTGRAFFMENVRQSFFPRRSACSQPLFSRIKRIGNQGEYEETER
jgi:predicted DNA-binding transcriptional regulator YafY